MKNPTPWILPACAMLLAGCADGSLTKRDDSRYVTLPVNSTYGTVGNDSIHSVTPLGASGSQIDPKKLSESTMVAAETPKEKKQREEQDKLDSDLAKLDGK